jgi:hypothetical protein
MDEEHRTHLQEQLRTLQRRLRVLERQRATFGAHIPAHIELEIEDVQAEIGEIEIALATENLWPSSSNTAPPPRRRSDHCVPIALPPTSVLRAELLEHARTALLAEPNPQPLTSAVAIAKPTALHGMGGIGKSVIARALCDDPAIQAAFPDGILWATIGQTPDLIGSLRSWIQALGGAVSESAPTVERLRANLAHLVGERAYLFVVDDIWRACLQSSCRGYDRTVGQATPPRPGYKTARIYRQAGASRSHRHLL